MSRIEFTDRHGSFRFLNPQNVSYLYFPVAGEGPSGIRSSVTPGLGGDAKRDQNTFLLEPVSSEDLHNNRATRNFWCKLATGGAWSATGISAETESFKGTEKEESCELNAGFMWHTLTRKSEKYLLSSEITTFVPMEFPEAEVTLITIKNESGKKCRFTPIAAVPVYGRSADNIRDHRHVTSLLHRGITNELGVEITPTLTFDERGHKKNQMTYYVYGAEGTGKLPVGTVPITEDFIGEGGSFTRPEAVYGEMSYVPAETGADGYEMTGALVFPDCCLAKGDEVSFVVAAGMDDKGNRAQLQNLLKTRSFKEWNASLEKTKTYWQEQVNIGFSGGDAVFDGYMKWVAFQPVLRRIYGCSFLPHHDYGKGGRGWRDLWQDCLALLLMNPDGVRQILLSNFDGVRMDGSNATIIGAKPGEFVADRNNITRVWMDHGFWPLHTIQFYINQTGDLNLLLEEAAYFKDRQAARGTKKDEQWNEAYGTRQKDENGTTVSGSVLEHILIQNLTACYDVGEHNCLLLRGADWNDALDMAADRGESVAFSYAYAGNLGVLCTLLEKLQEKGVEEISLAEETKKLLPMKNLLWDSAEEKRTCLAAYCDSVLHNVSGKKVTVSVEQLKNGLKKMEERMKATLRAEEWISGEPGFFNGYYDNNGRRVESSTEEIRMMLTGQVFAVMSGTANEAQIAELVQAADKYLYDKSRGGYSLNTDFREVKEDLGRMFGFAYGHKENGAVFSHMAVMFGNALYQRGFAEAGFKALDTLYRQAADVEVSKIYPGIPEYFNDRGRGMYHYLTGAASWYLMTVLTEMYGIKGCWGDLYFGPKLLKSQFDAEGQASVSFTFAGRKLLVKYRLENGENLTNTTECSCSISAKGKLWDSNVIPKEELLSWEEEEVHEITVIISG